MWLKGKNRAEFSHGKKNGSENISTKTLGNKREKKGKEKPVCHHIPRVKKDPSLNQTRKKELIFPFLYKGETHSSSCVFFLLLPR